MKRKTTITLTIVGALAAAGLSHAANPTVFASVNGPVGVAASPDKLIVSEFCTQNIDSIDGVGNVSLFATIPGPSGPCYQKYLAISPALGGWDPRYVYATQGADVYKVAPDGSSVTHFATIPNCGSDKTGITFDHVGTFGYDMIVTCDTGEVSRVDPSGNVTFVANTGTALEGPAVAPLSFGPPPGPGRYGGQLLVADDLDGQVHAIANDGTVTLGAFGWGGAEGVLVVPSNLCTFVYPSNGTLFSAISNFMSSDWIIEYPVSDFTGLDGSVLVTSETGAIESFDCFQQSFTAGTVLITWDGSGYCKTYFDTISGAQFEGSYFVDCDVPPPTPTATATPTAAATATATATATAAASSTPTATATATATPTPTPTPTPSSTPCALVAPNAQAATNITFNSFIAHWSSVNGATGYRLDVATDSSFINYVPGYQNFDVGNVTSYPVTGLSANTTYYYRLRAYNACGTSSNSNVKNVKTLACTPNAPNAQNATNVTAISFTAHWSSVNRAMDYRLDVATDSSFNNYVPGYQDLDAGDTTSYSVTGLNANTTYYYRVRAYNGCATSPNSNVKSVQTLPCTPAAPNAQGAGLVSSSSFLARWSSVSGAIDYRLDVSTSNTFTTYVPGYQDLSVGNVTSYDVYGLSANTTYYYRVRAYSGCAESANSNVINVKTKPH